MEHVSHLPYIVVAYVAATAVVGTLVAWIMLDYRAQKRALADLQLRGLARRSAPARPERIMGQAQERA